MQIGWSTSSLYAGLCVLDLSARGLRQKTSEFRPDGAERRPKEEEKPSHPSPPPMLETLKFAAGSRNRSKPAGEKIRARQPKKCSGCGELPTFAPKGTSSEGRARWHSSYGWCPNKKAFVTGGICPECNKTRADDSENHMANEFCKTMGPKGKPGKTIDKHIHHEIVLSSGLSTCK